MDIEEVARLSAEANADLVRGNIDGYLDRIVHAADYTLMAPFGGEVERGFNDTPERRAGMKKFFRSGTLEQEVVATYASGDFVVLVTVEHARTQVVDLPEQEWRLRVTQLFRRVSGGWELAHRHADPLGHGIRVDQAAVLARGAMP